MSYGEECLHRIATLTEAAVEISFVAPVRELAGLGIGDGMQAAHPIVCLERGGRIRDSRWR